MLGERTDGFFSDVGTRRRSIDDKTKWLLRLLHHLYHDGHGAQVMRAGASRDQDKIRSGVCRLDGIYSLRGGIDQNELIPCRRKWVRCSPSCGMLQRQTVGSELPVYSTRTPGCPAVRINDGNGSGAAVFGFHG